MNVLASDIDNTLTGDSKALEELSAALTSLRTQGRLFLVLSTGRNLSQILEGMREESLPEPDAVVSQVGTEIYVPPFHTDTPKLERWDRKLRSEFSRQQAETYLEGIEGVVMQPDVFNTPLKVSCYLDQAPDPEQAVAQIRERVSKDNAPYQVVWSSSRDLDIIPASAGKGKAIRFVLNDRQVEQDQVVVAGDSGNDRSMFDEFKKGIVVANAKDELKALKDKDSDADDFYFASQPYAAGVREGLEHFGFV